MNDPTNEPTIPHPSWCVPAECEFVSPVEGFHVGEPTVFRLPDDTGMIAIRLEQLVDEESPHPVRVRVQVVERTAALELARLADRAADPLAVDLTAQGDLSAGDARALAIALLDLAGRADALNAGGAR